MPRKKIDSFHNWCWFNNACQDGLDFVDGKSAYNFWRCCEVGDWLLWVFDMIGDELVKVGQTKLSDKLEELQMTADRKGWETAREAADTDNFKWNDKYRKLDAQGIRKVVPWKVIKPYLVAAKVPLNGMK